MPWTVCMSCMAPLTLQLAGNPSTTLTATHHSHTPPCITIPHTHILS